MVRFTHLLNTNDSFEVRKTFRRFSGPKLNDAIMRAALEQMNPEYLDQKIQEKMQESGINIPNNLFREMIISKFGMPIEELMRIQLSQLAPTFLSGLDSVKTPEEFLTEIGSILLCFSLSERYDIATMWAHYAGNHSGIVVTFDTENLWFKQKSDPTKSSLQKIKYVDEQNDELLDDLQAAFSSKATDWASEREWRLSCSEAQIEKVIDIGTEKIYLRSFPPEAVHSVILGSKASDITIERAKETVRTKYPHAKLQKAIPDRMTSKFRLEDVN